MFDSLKKLIFDRPAEEDAPASFSADEKQLAEAALMFHVIAADGIVTDDERKTLSRLLSSQFGLGADETAALIEQARNADNEAIDLYGFTRVLKRSLTHEERLELVRNLWKMVFADGVVHEFEDNVVWRVAELLDVDSRDRMEIKRSVSRSQADS
ncbi:MAG: TerB family tellurite resistance protein [Pseudomonadota bacterium]